MNVYLENFNNNLRLHYNSRYASGSIPVNNPQDLIYAIEEVCGKGSYCFFYRPTKPDGYPQVIHYNDYDKYPNLPRLTFWQDGVKTQVIEQARDVAKEVWGDIPEMKIGWLQNQMKTYVD